MGEKGGAQVCEPTALYTLMFALGTRAATSLASKGDTTSVTSAKDANCNSTSCACA